MNKKETIFIAGPMVFEEGGYTLLDSMRYYVESLGHNVSQPNDIPIDTTHENQKKNADAILENLAHVINRTTMMVVNLDQFRSSEPDGGSIFEAGMAYAHQLKIYGFSKDIRPLIWKDPNIKGTLKKTFDENGFEHPYSMLPFSPLVVAAIKLVEGTFKDVFKVYETDNYFGHDFTKYNKESIVEEEKSIFIAPRHYYTEKDLENYTEKVKELRDEGYTIKFPYFEPYRNNCSVSEWLNKLIHETTKRIDQSKYFVADLNNLRGYEPSADVSFMAGYAFEKQKKLYGYLDDSRPMIEKIPNTYIDGKYKDFANRDVENFNYPVNLMYASTMEIIKGDLSNWKDSFLKKAVAK